MFFARSKSSRAIGAIASLLIANAAVGYELNTRANHETRTVAGQRVVVDRKYNLMWETKSDSPADFNYSERVFTATEAAEYAEHLNSIAYAGRTDWRIPTEHEMATLVDLGHAPGAPAIDEEFFPLTGPHFYWTSSRWELFPIFDRSITFASGSVFQWDRDGKMRARAVSGGGWVGLYDPENIYDPKLLYADENNETVIDEVTGLQWEQKSFDGGVPWLSPEATKATLQETVNAAKFTLVYPELFVNFGGEVAMDPAAQQPPGADSMVSIVLNNFVESSIEPLVRAVTSVLNELSGSQLSETSPIGPRSWYLFFTHDEALAYIDWMNDKGGAGYPGGYAGHKDWRLPSADEMLTIADWQGAMPLVKDPYYPNFPSTYWTRDFDPTTQHPFFFCTASLVITSYINKDYGLLVRAVRGEMKPLVHKAPYVTQIDDTDVGQGPGTTAPVPSESAPDTTPSPSRQLLPLLLSLPRQRPNQAQAR